MSFSFLVRLAWRNIAFRPAKTIASVLGIGIGIAAVVAVLTIDHNTLLTQERLRIPSDPDSDLLIEPNTQWFDTLDEMVADLDAEPLVQGVTPWSRGRLALWVGGEQKGLIDLMAVGRGASTIHGGYLVAEGEDLDFDEREVPEILLSPGLAERFGLGVGDLIDVTPPPTRARATTRTRCVDGEWVVESAGRGGGRGPAEAGGARPSIGAGPVAGGAGKPFPFRVAGILEPTRLGYPRDRALTTLAIGEAALGAQFRPQFWANFDTASTDYQGIEQALRGRFVVRKLKRSLAGQAPEEAAFRNGVRYCGFLALFLGLYIIFNTMSMSLVERVQHIGLLRALGLTNGQLLAAFLVEGLVLAALGAGLSLLLAAGIVWVLEEMQITTLGFGKPLMITSIPWTEVVVVILAGVVFSLLGILYPFLRAVRLSVIEALRRGVIELSRDPFTGVRRSLLIVLLALLPIAWFVGNPSGQWVPTPLYESVLKSIAIVAVAFAALLLWPGVLSSLSSWLTRPFRGPAVVLARTTLASSRNRVFGTVSGLMLVFAAVFLVVSVLESLKAETRGFGERALHGRVYVKLAPLGEGTFDALRELPGLDALVPLNNEIHSPFLVRGVDPRVLGTGALADDQKLRSAFATTPSILLSTRCAEDFDYVAGEEVELMTASEGPVSFRVLAITDEYGFAPDERAFGVISTENMRRFWCQTSEGLGNYFAAWAPGLTDAQLDGLASDITVVVGEDAILDLRTGEQITDDYVADLERNFAIFYAILVLTVLLAAVGILNAMVIAVLERRREIGLLRSVGLTGGQVARMLLVESGVLGVLGGAFGLVVGIPLAVFTTDALTSMSHLDLSFGMTPRALVAVTLGAVLIALLAVLYPALRANRLRLADVMRYE